MMHQIVNKFPDDILFEQEGPFISLYQPTNRHAPENKQDPIVYRNLLKTIEASLAHQYTSKDMSASMNVFAPDRGTMRNYGTTRSTGWQFYAVRIGVWYTNCMTPWNRWRL